MKNLLIILSVLVLIACGGNTSKTEKSDVTDKETSIGSSCDDFLDDYEEWIDQYIVLYKQFKEDPTNMEYTEKMMESSEKMMEWSEKWTKLYKCATNKKYAKRMEELSERLQKELDELE